MGGQDLRSGPQSARQAGPGRSPDLSHRGDVSQAGSGRADLDPGRSGRLPGPHALHRLHPGRGHAGRLGHRSGPRQGYRRLRRPGPLPRRRSQRNRSGGAQDPLSNARKFSRRLRQLPAAWRGRALRLVFQLAIGGQRTAGPDRAGRSGADPGSRQALRAAPPLQGGG